MANASSSALRSFLSLTLCAFLFGSCNRPPAAETPKQITVAAASDLTPAFTELGRAFEEQTKIKVIFSFGSTGMLAQQISNGAPFDVFAAANVVFVDQLEQNGLTVPGTKALYARGRITLWTTKDAAIKPEKITDLARPEIKRVAIANPEHAPYGMAARQAFESAGVWETVKPKIVYSENIRQAMQFTQTGNVDVGIVALSLSIGSDGHWVLVPEELHQPLDQALAVIKSTKHEPEARQFALYINSPSGRLIMRKYGFTLSGESSTP